MSFSARDTLNIASEHRAPPQAPALAAEGLAPAPDFAETDDLDRVQSCLDWLNRERMILALETTARKAPLHLPRAAQLAPVPAIEALAKLPLAALAPPGALPPGKAPAHTPDKHPLVPSPPLACDRLQPPLPRRPRRSGTMLLVLVSAAIAGSLAYYATMGTFPVPSLAQAAAIETP